VNYKALNNEVIEELREIGLWFPDDTRLDLFWLRNAIQSLADTDRVREITFGLDTLVTLRTEGEEPPSKDGRYT
jgi:hypothetical protein